MFATPRHRIRPALRALLLGLGLAPAPPAAAVHVLDFERLAAGDVVTEAAPGVTLETAAGPGHTPRVLAVAVRSGKNRDEGRAIPKIDWHRGNLPRDTDLGIVVVVTQAEERPARDDVHFGGSISIRFGRPMSSLGFDLVDVEGRLGLGSLEFLLGGRPVAEVEFSAFLDPGSPLYDGSLVFRRLSGNRFGPFASALAGAPFFDEVIFHLDGLVALDNVVVMEPTPVPEPASLGLLGAGLIALGGGRRIRRLRAPAPR
jgi:hypothetical protein